MYDLPDVLCVLLLQQLHLELCTIFSSLPRPAKLVNIQTRSTKASLPQWLHSSEGAVLAMENALLGSKTVLPHFTHQSEAHTNVIRTSSCFITRQAAKSRMSSWFFFNHVAALSQHRKQTDGVFFN